MLHHGYDNTADVSVNTEDATNMGQIGLYVREFLYLNGYVDPLTLANMLVNSVRTLSGSTIAALPSS